VVVIAGVVTVIAGCLIFNKLQRRFAEEI
jgi:hypothetical protein